MIVNARAAPAPDRSVVEAGCASLTDFKPLGSIPDPLSPGPLELSRRGQLHGAKPATVTNAVRDGKNAALQLPNRCPIAVKIGYHGAQQTETLIYVVGDGTPGLKLLAWCCPKQHSWWGCTLPCRWCRNLRKCRHHSTHGGRSPGPSPRRSRITGRGWQCPALSHACCLQLCAPGTGQRSTPGKANL